MPQLNVLPVDVSQSTDFKAETQYTPDKGQGGSDRFSEMVDRHLNNEKSGKSSQKTADSGNNVSKSKSDVASDEIKESASKESVNGQPEQDKIESAETNTVIDSKASDEPISKGGDQALDGNNETSDSREISELVELGFDKPNEESEFKTPEKSIELQKSQHFISLVDSANKILQANGAEQQFKEVNNEDQKSEFSELDALKAKYQIQQGKNPQANETSKDSSNITNDSKKIEGEKLAVLKSTARVITNTVVFFNIFEWRTI